MLRHVVERGGWAKKRGLGCEPTVGSDDGLLAGRTWEPGAPGDNSLLAAADSGEYCERKFQVS